MNTNLEFKMEEKITLMQAAEEVLRDDGRSRKDTKWYVIQVLRKLGIKIWIDYRDLKNLPSFEAILRTKRIIQNERNLYNEENLSQPMKFIPEEGVTYE